jgi:hypothetical protein
MASARRSLAAVTGRLRPPTPPADSTARRPRPPSSRPRAPRLGDPWVRAVLAADPVTNRQPTRPPSGPIASKPGHSGLSRPGHRRPGHHSASQPSRHASQPSRQPPRPARSPTARRAGRRPPSCQPTQLPVASQPRSPVAVVADRCSRRSPRSAPIANCRSPGSSSPQLPAGPVTSRPGCQPLRSARLLVAPLRSVRLLVHGRGSRWRRFSAAPAWCSVDGRSTSLAPTSPVHDSYYGTNEAPDKVPKTEVNPCERAVRTDWVLRSGWSGDRDHG